jgi:hypothetical protein
MGLGENGGNLSNVWVVRAESHQGWVLYYSNGISTKLTFSPHNEYPLPNVLVTQVDITS